MTTITFYRGYPRRATRRFSKPLILSVMEEANYDYHRIDEIIEKRTKNLRETMLKIKQMTHEEFLKWISSDLFGVALKGYYIAKYENRLKELEGVKASIDCYTELYIKNPQRLDSLLKLRRDYKGWIRELKEAIRRVARTRYNLKISQFF